LQNLCAIHNISVLRQSKLWYLGWTTQFSLVLAIYVGY
jgi:hypothetical protein